VADLDRAECIRQARIWLEGAEQGMKLAVKLNDPDAIMHAGQMASVSSAFSALALVVPDPMPADLPDEIKARIQAHHNKGHFTT
jgi:hypothetical protein